jgi:hypothetical protein
MLVSRLPRHVNNDDSLPRSELTGEFPGLDARTLPPPCSN